LGRRRAGAAITLCRLGQDEAAQTAFRVEKDPESLTQFVHGLKPRHLDADLLAKDLERAVEEPVRFGLILSLGEFTIDELRSASRSRLVEKLVDSYRRDPSSAIHAASGWLLRKWGLESETTKVDHTPLLYDPSGLRQWFVVEVGSGPDRDDFTFVVFRPGEFQMGSPVQEAFRDNDESPHRVRLTGSFALCDRELTESQWRRFEKSATAFTAKASSSRIERPAAGLSWPKAVAYCRWLTGRAGLAAGDQCYEIPSGEEPPRVELTGATSPRDSGPQSVALRVNWDFHPERRGFRLPTESEWEFAARAATITTFSFGSDAAVLDEYAWRLDDPARQLHGVATLRPNLRGLFDVHGNAWEWCHDFYDEYPSGTVTDPVGTVTPRPSHVARGGGWGPPLYCRSAYRSGLPQARGAALGLRLAITLPVK
jgi:formylglycine-generating enzyme required for sulfatase activity